MKGILFIFGGLLLLQASIEDWLDRVFPSIQLRVIVAILLILYGLFALNKNGSLKSLINDIKRMVGVN